MTKITEEMLLEFAREGAAINAMTPRARAGYLEGALDKGVGVKAGLCTARVMIERGWRPMPSVDCVWQALHWNTRHVFSRDEARVIHAALLPPLTPSRVQQAREALGISQDVPDETVAKWIGGE